MTKIYAKEFLISELHRFVKENDRIPKQVDMQTKSGYPSYAVYQYHFKTWNKVLEIVGFKLNQKHQTGKLDGTETCCYCGKKTNEIPNFINWVYDENGIRFCHKHGQHEKPYYTKGKLDKSSTTGKAFISQRVVAKALNLDIKNDCNCSIGFNHPYDLYDKDKYKYINVKSSKLNYNVYQSSSWNFSLTQNEIPDTYILVGLDYNEKNILHVWITDPLDDLVYDEKNEKPKKHKKIMNIYESLKKAKPWEVDPKPYNDMLHKMSQKRKDNNGDGCFLSNSDLRVNNNGRT